MIFRSAHLLICSLIIFPLFGQSQTRVGISGGGTSANFEYPEQNQNAGYESEKKLGFNGGIKVDIPLVKSQMLKLTPELFINQNGAKDQYFTSWLAIRDSMVNNKISLDYIGIYFPVKFNLQAPDGAGIFLTAAFYADYTISAKIASNQIDGEDIEFKSEADKIDMGYRFSFGLMVSEGVGIEVGYNEGIKNIEFATKLNSNTTQLVNNRGLTLSLVALF
ncbi:MAG TPA: outer membrane beta-barrel protein [Chitinophagaceae bacterium]|nr:outer membrane beta-barrel protein [Chitinophagaceae bacterium]